MFCARCGTPVNSNARFCPSCGATLGQSQPSTPAPAVPTWQPQPSAPAAPIYAAPPQFPDYSQPPLIRQSKLSTGAKVWCWLCIIANFIAANLNVVAATTSRGLTDQVLGLLIVSTLLAYTAFSGYIVLLCGKKAGFWMICAAAVLCAILNLVALAIPQAAFNLLNPIITWLFIRENWSRWPEIDKANKAAKLDKMIRRAGGYR